MRKLSETFMDALKDGILSRIRKKVIEDKDLDLQIRNNYLNLYYKGNSLLKLKEVHGTKYKVDIHSKFVGDLSIPEIKNQKTADLFLGKIPDLKENILKHGRSSLELEYEQLIIRANNDELRNNSEYFIIDRQYVGGAARFDLMGFFWDRNNRRREQEVPLCFMEVKFALNQDIKSLHSQIGKYYKAIKGTAGKIAEEAEVTFRQKLALDLFEQPLNRVEALKTLTFSKKIEQFQFILVLVDYNPNSTQLKLDKLRKLPFSDQISVFYSGFAMWQQDLKSLSV